MKYVKTVNVWNPDVSLQYLQPGQWVSAGNPERGRHNVGRFYGVTNAGSAVVAWNGNARRSDLSWNGYQQMMSQYAKSRR
jgi:hypothetical protein